MKHAAPFVSLTWLFIVAGCIVFRKHAAPQNANLEVGVKKVMEDK